MTPATTIAALGRAARLLRAAAGDAEVQEVGEILSTWLATGAAPRLEEELGLIGRPGQRRAATKSAREERDNLLRKAAARFHSGLSVAAQAKAMASEMAFYEATAWPREADVAACPGRHDRTIREYYWRVLRLHRKSPSAERLRRILVTSDRR